MARLPRFVLPGQPQHVIQRGNNRQIIFSDDADRRYFLAMLNDACQSFECRVHAYVLMTNHVHLLMTPDAETSIGQVMQSLGRRYVQYFNRRHHRTGTLWEGRYRATLVDSESYLLTCYRYIELNPVRAGMVDSPADYPWSSYRHNALGHPDSLVAAHALYQALGLSDSLRRQSYRGLFVAPIDKSQIDDIREATNKAWALGNDEFKDRMQRLLERQARPKPRGGDRRSSRFRDQKRINRG
jgi:putative transposase